MRFTRDAFFSVVTIDYVVVFDDHFHPEIAICDPKSDSDNWIWIPRSWYITTQDGIQMPKYLAIKKGLV